MTCPTSRICTNCGENFQPYPDEPLGDDGDHCLKCIAALTVRWNEEWERTEDALHEGRRKA